MDSWGVKRSHFFGLLVRGSDAQIPWPRLKKKNTARSRARSAGCRKDMGVPVNFGVL